MLSNCWLTWYGLKDRNRNFELLCVAILRATGDAVVELGLEIAGVDGVEDVTGTGVAFGVVAVGVISCETLSLEAGARISGAGVVVVVAGAADATGVADTTGCTEGVSGAVVETSCTDATGASTADATTGVTSLGARAAVVVINVLAGVDASDLSL